MFLDLRKLSRMEIDFKKKDTEKKRNAKEKFKDTICLLKNNLCSNTFFSRSIHYYYSKM